MSRKLQKQLEEGMISEDWDENDIPIEYFGMQFLKLMIKYQFYGSLTHVTSAIK